MARSVKPFAAAAILAVLLSGCGYVQRPERPAWRGQAESVCLAEHLVQATAYTRPVAAIDGPGVCGMDHPFKVTALAGGTVELNATQTIGCPLTAALDQWVHDSVQPLAMARFGQPVTRINSMGSFSCRTIDNIPGKGLSEHSFGNAIDIGGFRLADGHEFSVVKAWTRGDDQEKAFLREVQAGACQFFTTVLAPGSDSFHYNHIHLDLAMHGRTSTGPRRICKPRPAPQLVPAPGPRDGLPDAPDIDEEQDVAARAGGRGMGFAGGLDMATPLAPPRAPEPRQAFAPAAAIARTRAPTRGTMDDNGVFTPDGDPDSTSAIPAQRR